jgi:hypothetical protein
MRRVGLAVAAVVFVLSASGATAAARTYSAVAQFCNKFNPYHAWSYTVGGAILTQQTNISTDNGRFEAWWNGHSIPTSAIVGVNRTTKTLSFYTIELPPGYIILDPEYETDSAVEWTAPTTGTFTVAGEFLGIDTHEASHPVAIEHNGSTIYSNTISAYQQTEPFNLTVTVAAGDTISFMADTNGFEFLSTGLQATITG